MPTVRRHDPESGVTYIEGGNEPVHLPSYAVPIEPIENGQVPPIDSYIDDAIAEAHLLNESRLALALGVTRSTISNWRHRKAWPSDKVMLKLAELACTDPDLALVHLNIWRNDRGDANRVYRHLLSLLHSTKLPAIIPYGLTASVSWLSNDAWHNILSKIAISLMATTIVCGLTVETRAEQTDTNNRQHCILSKNMFSY